MSNTYIPASLRREVIARAQGCCEYCRVGQDDRAIEFAIDHIIAEKHGGETTTLNLCLSCYWCNSYKGSDLSSVDWLAGGQIVPLFNPRQNVWNEHFQLNGAYIESLTPVGRFTTSQCRRTFRRTRIATHARQLSVFCLIILTPPRSAGLHL